MRVDCYVILIDTLMLKCYGLINSDFVIEFFNMKVLLSDSNLNYHSGWRVNESANYCSTLKQRNRKKVFANKNSN